MVAISKLKSDQIGPGGIARIYLVVVTRRYIVDERWLRLRVQLRCLAILTIGHGGQVIGTGTTNRHGLVRKSVSEVWRIVDALPSA